MLKIAVTAFGLALATAAPAHALCGYHGIDNVKTTVEQEFRDARWVVRAHVVSADYHWSDEDESWVLYRLKVVRSFKGRLTERFTFFSWRNSGGFYLDADHANPDMDGDFLLFLNPSEHSADEPPAARGALWVNYNCGQSKPWGQVSSAEAAQLDILAGGH